ncbi:MAG: sigma-54 dependent transcriptional regulator [Nitrospirae bacterium]|nr:sigma-54 dependent transcriptional regulator [Nitrospirota bacterium]MCL5977243.1 sigma-54 dependent transcriptional regulator [Nitrospirota bacterium]
MGVNKGRILVIEDDEEMLENYSRLLKRMDYECIMEKDSVKAAEELSRLSPDVILTDLRMPGKSGFDILGASRELNPDMPVILITAYANISTAVEAVKQGAFDFIAKPFTSEQLRIAIERAMRQKTLADENKQLKEQLKASSMIDEIIGKSPAIQEVIEVIKRVSQTDANILITGESGTGKELVAKAIHARSLRKSEPFVPVDCAALPENLLESELFGYEKGAFTGANTNKPGLFEAAHGGTLFLDEIGEIPMTMQAKLLRAIQERQVRRLGSNKLISIDVRIISATNRDIKKSIPEKTFREDLYYRLNVIQISVPPLRERMGDIPVLALHFMDRFTVLNKKDIRSISPDAMEAMESYLWPGNVRELQNIMERAVVLCDADKIAVEDLPKEICTAPSLPPVENLPYKNAKEAWLAAFERNYLTSLLKGTSGNISRAAQKAGIDRKTIHRLIKRYRLNTEA